MLLPVLIIVVVTVVACRATEPFSPHPSLAAVRYLVLSVSAVAAILLVASVFQVWWTVEDWEREQTLVTHGHSAYPLTVVGLGLVSVALVTAGVLGRRNWAPAVLWFAWSLVAWAWFASTGEPTDSDASGVAGSGLSIVTWAMLLTTVALLMGSLSRIANRHRTRADGRVTEGEMNR